MIQVFKGKTAEWTLLSTVLLCIDLSMNQRRFEAFDLNKQKHKMLKALKRIDFIDSQFPNKIDTKRII